MFLLQYASTTFLKVTVQAKTLDFSCMSVSGSGKLCFRLAVRSQAILWLLRKPVHVCCQCKHSYQQNQLKLWEHRGMWKGELSESFCRSSTFQLDSLSSQVGIRAIVWSTHTALLCSRSL